MIQIHNELHIIVFIAAGSPKKLKILKSLMRFVF